MSEESNKPNWLNRLSAFWHGESNHHPLEALAALLQQAQQQQVLNEETARMLENVLEINTLQVRDIMIPRGQMVLIEEAWDLNQVLAVIVEAGHSRYPVVDEEHKQLRGILLSKDLLPLWLKPDASASWQDVVRTATIVPESKALDSMLRDFKSNRNHMALVIDEYGALSGLVTIEDVIEEIVGEIDDEHDEIEDANILPLNDGSFQIKALTPIEEFNEAFQCAWSDENVDTVGGLILEQLGYLPPVGESMNLNDWQVTVLKANQKRLILLHFNKKEALEACFDNENKK